MAAYPPARGKHSSNPMEIHRADETGSDRDLPLVSPSLYSFRPRGAYRMRIISGTSNPKLSEDIARRLSSLSKADGQGPVPIEDCDISQFNDGEIQIQVHKSVRGSDVFVILPICPQRGTGETGGVNSNLMELLLLLHTLRFSSAKRITAIIPYFAYARQDRKTKPRVPISASVVAQLIETMGPDRIVTVDLHCGQIQGFFHHTPVDNLYAENQILEYLRRKGFCNKPDQLCIVSPDAGGVGRATRVANKTGAKHIVTILKRRVVAGSVDSMQLVGDVTGLICVIVDDMIDTAGTLCKAAQLLKDNGALHVFCFATHGLFSGEACERINSSCLAEVCVTDSIPQDRNLAKCPKLTVISLADLLSDAIFRLHNEESLSELFTERPSAPTVISPSLSSRTMDNFLNGDGTDVFPPLFLDEACDPLRDSLLQHNHN